MKIISTSLYYLLLGFWCFYGSAFESNVEKYCKEFVSKYFYFNNTEDWKQRTISIIQKVPKTHWSCIFVHNNRRYAISIRGYVVYDSTNRSMVYNEALSEHSQGNIMDVGSIESDSLPGEKKWEIIYLAIAGVRTIVPAPPLDEKVYRTN